MPIPPIRSPKANAVAERFVGTIRRECLDHILVFGERHLEQVLKECVRHYNEERPHRGLSPRTPEPTLVPQHPAGEVVRTGRLGGLINEYHREAA
ncbi:MAG TPA: integrase core domain-containing protein [Thermoleophilia bacterium]